MPDSFDTVIVGGGTAGCVIASRLSERVDRSVLLLEAGPDYGPFAAGQWPADILDPDAVADESHDWGFDAQSATRAKILGGCSSHNECAVVWPPPADYQAWAELGGQGWTFEQQRPLLERAQGLLNTQSDRADGRDPLVEAFFSAAEEIGVPVLDDLNELPLRSGVSSIPVNVRDGVRWNTAFAYLDNARKRPNLTIQADTLVDRITFEGTRASGVVGDRFGAKAKFIARTIVLTAGTYMSPAILQRSGVGPRETLDRLGVEPVADLPAVGASLLDHPMVRVVFAMEDSVGPSVGFQAALLKARSDRCVDEYWDTHILLFAAPPEEGEERELAFSVAAVQSDSTGLIRLPSSDPRALPELTQPFTSLTERDAAVLAQGIQTVRHLAQTDSLEGFLGPELEPGPGGDLDAYVRASAGGYWHPVGTCPMGNPDDRGSVVDPTGRVHGTEGLVVADASIFPTIPRANTSLPTIGIAEFIASTIW